MMSLWKLTGLVNECLEIFDCLPLKLTRSGRALAVGKIKITCPKGSVAL